MIMKRFVLGVLAIIAAALLWNFLTKALFYNPTAFIQENETLKTEKTAIGNALDYAWGEEILSKNLFSPQRGYIMPPEIKEPQAPQDKEEKADREAVMPVRPNFALNGIIRNQYGEYIALIKKDNEHVIPLRLGDTLGGAKVTEINERSVEMLWSGEKITLMLSSVKTMKLR